ncbi:MAG TPA: hypothetical protein VL133_03965, partial [Devosia sp.]|nr:hypothetical protein [Devosia sp.]
MSSPALTRRALLAGAGTTFASAALAVPYVNAAHSEEVSATAFDPETRYERAVAELRAAALALQPDLDVWNINRTAMGVLVWGYSSEEAAK